MGGRIEDRIAVLVEPIVQKLCLELVDVQYRKEGANWYLRVFIDKNGGVDLEDCRRVSEGLSAAIDESDPIPHRYLLEVSSPGVERPLKKKADFIRFQGHKIKMKTYAPIDGQRNFHGFLRGVEGECIIVEVGKERISVPLEQVAKARLAPEF